MSENNHVMSLTVSFEKATHLVENIDGDYFQQGKEKYWKQGGKAGVTAQSICWLYCWVESDRNRKNKVAPEARRIFNKIFNRSHEWFGTRISSDEARELRYLEGDIEARLHYLLTKS